MRHHSLVFLSRCLKNGQTPLQERSSRFSLSPWYERRMTGTTRLDFDDPLLFTFTARVLERGVRGNRRTLVMDTTAFYPESGGQMADHGVIGNVAVVDVQSDGYGIVHHIMAPDGDLPKVGDEVSAVLDSCRRRFHMAQHTGQHLLSAALLEVARAKTVSSRLGEGASTIDVDRTELNVEELERAEALVNEIIENDVEVRTFFPTQEELASMALRRRSKVDTNVRVVAVGDVDLVACGGTHCTRTSQIGLVTILSAERYKGMTRVTFVAGRLARTLLSDHYRLLKRLAADFTCAAPDVPKAIDNLRSELTSTKESLNSVTSQLAKFTARELLAETTAPLVVGSFDGADAAFLREVGTRIVAEPVRVALLAAPGPEGTTIFVARGEASDFDSGDFVRALTKAVGGRGGGRPAHAEGRLPPGIDWLALVAEQANTRKSKNSPK